MTSTILGIIVFLNLSPKVRKVLVWTFVLGFSFLVNDQYTWANEYVRGHVKKNGTYVAPYIRSTPDSTVYNNYSYRPTPAPKPVYPSYQYQAPKMNTYQTPTYPAYKPLQIRRY